MENSLNRHKKTIAVLATVFSVIVFLSVFVTMWFYGDTYPDFADFREEVAIPGLSDGAAPQGITTYEYNVLDGNGTLNEKQKDTYFFISAYLKDKPSRVYVTGKKSGYIGFVTMRDENDKIFTGHAGGVATNGGTFWLGSGTTVYCARTAVNSGYKNMVHEIIAKAKTSGEIKFSGSFYPNCRASFLSYYDDPLSSGNDKLLVGEFYRDGSDKYDTADDRKIPLYRDAADRILKPDDIIIDGKKVYKNDDGKKGEEIKGAKPVGNSAFMVEYRPYISDAYNTSNKVGLNVMLINGTYVPSVQKIYSIPDEVQGAAIHPVIYTERDKDGNDVKKVSRTLVLSVSYGLKNSHLLCYDFSNVENGNYIGYKELTGSDFEYKDIGKAPDGKNIYIIDKLNLVDDYSIPCMSEGLCVTGGARDRVCVLFESGAKKYRSFVRQKLTSVYSFIPEKR